MHSPSNVVRLAVSLCAGLALVCVSASAAEAPRPGEPVAVDDLVADRSQVEWSQAYQQWIGAFARDASPISDTSGALCAARQDGEVWFLATSDGTGPVVRACTIPTGKTLFVPIVSTSQRSGNREPDCASMSRLAAETISQQVSRLSLAVDGIPVEGLERHRLASDSCFSLGLRQTPRLTARTAVGDGIYVMLRPLAPGAHTIVIGAKFGNATLSTTYRLDVH
jgi:hypothetical protein